MKREGSDHHLYHLHHSMSVPMANCALTLLSDHAAFSSAATRMFECKTCNRQFSSFQALGGHRASHKKPRIMAVDGDNNNNDGSSSSSSSSSQSAAKPKTHECSICGLEFAIGQALGGHMRRHRVPSIISDHNNINSAAATKKNNKKVDVNGDDDDSKRLSSLLFLDLNLTPSQNHLEFLRIASNPTSTATPLLDCFY